MSSSVPGAFTNLGEGKDESNAEKAIDQDALV
jgi:hypothetical protein